MKKLRKKTRTHEVAFQKEPEKYNHSTNECYKVKKQPEDYHQKKKAKKDLHALIQDVIKNANKNQKIKHGKDLKAFSKMSVSDNEKVQKN